MISNWIKPIQHFFNVLVKSRWSALLLTIAIVVLNIAVKLFERSFGDGDGQVSGHLKFVYFEINIALLIALIFACKFKFSPSYQIEMNRTKWGIAIVLAWLGRLFFAHLGYNFDMESYDIVADIILKGQSVYHETTRYNYAPIWAYMLGGLKFLTSFFSNDINVFHYFVVTCLFVFEALFYRDVYKKFGDNVMLLILLFNPVSLIIIGHHSQFDIIAVFFAFRAYLAIDKQDISKAVIYLALSFCVKHVFVLFPLFFLFDSKLSIKQKASILIIPSVVFVLSFMPFYKDLGLIKENVFSYQFNYNQTLLKHVIDIVLPSFVSHSGLFKILPVFTEYKFFWLLTIVYAGYLVQRYKMENTYLLYTVFLVASSLAISEQYFITPLLAVVYYRKSIWSWLYLGAASYYIAFVSYNNTAKYLSLKDIGIPIEFDRFQLSFAQVQLCLLLLFIQVYRESRKI